MVDVVLVPGVDGLNPNENLGVLSAGLGGSEAEVVLVVVVAVWELKVGAGLVELGAGAGVFATWGPNLAASDGTFVFGTGVGVDSGRFGCSTGLGAAKSEGPDPVPPTLGKANVDFVVEVVGGVG